MEINTNIYWVLGLILYLNAGGFLAGIMFSEMPSAEQKLKWRTILYLITVTYFGIPITLLTLLYKVIFDVLDFFEILTAIKYWRGGFDNASESMVRTIQSYMALERKGLKRRIKGKLHKYWGKKILARNPRVVAFVWWNGLTEGQQLLIEEDYKPRPNSTMTVIEAMHELYKDKVS